CADCVNDSRCAQVAAICNRYSFAGGTSGQAYNDCLNNTQSYLDFVLDDFSLAYEAPGSNIINDPSLPFTRGDGKCNQALAFTGYCTGYGPLESCYNDPEDCGPCPTIQNITDPNIANGSCDPTQCAKGVCTTGQCSSPSACQFNCGSAHYGGTN